ncbi:hypothetical protein [Jiangella asiatica]|uniref:Uncharacterized protein n=1 Tax=Jiangella asiatica TaxID=2530372 RepID=A0A4V2Z3H4_9ACTN|nr:hypothetical protein [Jiangella asiatica]TDE12638.1 hypothetical protein E1269_07330 [Jiangella asiatica]
MDVNRLRDHPYAQGWQRVLNEHWPAQPGDFEDRSPGIPVRARVVWETDGEEYLSGLAVRWDRDHVYVRLHQHGGRLSAAGVWLKPADIYRNSS